MRRRLWTGLIALPVIVLIAAVLFWHVATSRLEAGFQAWIADARARGLTVASGAVTFGGLPFAATLTVTDLAVSGGEPVMPGGFFWDVKRLVLRVDALDPWTLHLTPIGVQRLRFAGGPDLPFVAEDMHLTVPLQPDLKTTSIDLLVSRLRAALPADGDSSESLTVGQITCHADITPAAQAGEAAVAFSVNADTIGLPTHVRWPLGPTMASITVDGALDGPWPATASITSFATAWRDGGGSLEVQKFNLAWGPLSVSGAATLALDDQLQPMGAGTSRLIGYDATLDALSGNGVLTRSAAKAAKAVLSLLASAPSGNDPIEVEVPLTLQFRTLSMRQVPLIRLPELDWPMP